MNWSVLRFINSQVSEFPQATVIEICWLKKSSVSVDKVNGLRLATVEERCQPPDIKDRTILFPTVLNCSYGTKRTAVHVLFKDMFLEFSKSLLGNVSLHAAIFQRK